MKKFLKSIFLIAAVFCFVMSTAFAAPSDELDALMKDMNKVNNGKVDVFVDGKFLDDTFKAVTRLNFESKPTTLIRGETELIVYDKGNLAKGKKTAYEFYAEDEGKQYTYYYTEKGKNKWFKDSFSNDDKKTEKDTAQAAINKIDPNMLDELTGTVEYDNNYTSTMGKGDKVGYKVTADIAKLAQAASAVALENASEEDAKTIQTFVGIGKNLPPISATIVGDTKNREIVAVYLPLTDFLKGANQAIASYDKLDPMAKVIAVAALTNAELEIKAEGKDYNKVKVEKLPDNIKKKAKQVENKDKNKDKK